MPLMHSTTKIAQLLSALARRGDSVVSGGLLGGLLLALSAGAQQPTQAQWTGLLVADAVRLTKSTDATTRGEAALLLAAIGDPRTFPEILCVAKDQKPAAQLRGILSLGRAAVSGAETFLRARVEASGTRAQPDGIVAAFALGILPDAHADSIVSNYLGQVVGASYKRQHDILLALLLGLATHSATPQKTALTQLADDASMRDPVLRNATLLSLSKIANGISASRFASQLQHGSADDRRAILTLADSQQSLASLLPVFANLCEHDPNPEVRSLALAALTQARDQQALALAQRALRSTEPVEVEQATRTVLLFGGSSMCATVEALFADASPACLTAILTAFRGPLTEPAQTLLQKIAADRKNPVSLRTAAALALGQASISTASPSIRDAFIDERDPNSLRALAAALLQLVPDQPPELQSLHSGSTPTDLALQPDHLAALLIARHPNAQRFCLEQLQNKDLPAAALCGVLRACHLSLTSPLPTLVQNLLPATVREIL